MTIGRSSFSNGTGGGHHHASAAHHHQQHIRQLFRYCQQGDLQGVEQEFAWHMEVPRLKTRSPLKRLFSLTSSANIADAADERNGECLLQLCDPPTGHTALHRAALHGQLAVVQLLLAKEQRLQAASDRRGCLPLHLAAWNGFDAVVWELLTPTTLNALNNAKESAMHLSVMKGHERVVRLLLQHGADAMLRNARSETALDIAARLGRAEICQVLIEERPELVLQLARDCSTSPSPLPYPLHAAVHCGSVECLEVLCNANFDVNHVSEEGCALHLAALQGNVDVVRFLLSHGANPLARDFRGKVVLELLADLQKGTGHRDSATTLPPYEEEDAWAVCCRLIEASIEALHAISLSRQSTPIVSKRTSVREKPKVKPRSGSLKATMLSQQSTADKKAAAVWMPIPESAQARLCSAKVRPLVAPKAIRPVLEKDGGGAVASPGGCNYQAPSEFYDAWIGQPAQCYTNVAGHLAGGVTQQGPPLPLNYDNVPRSLFVYDNAPLPGHKRWQHTCAFPTTSGVHPRNGPSSPTIPLSTPSETQSEGEEEVVSKLSESSENNNSCESITHSHAKRLAPLALPEEVSRSNSANLLHQGPPSEAHRHQRENGDCTLVRNAPKRGESTSSTTSTATITTAADHRPHHNPHHHQRNSSTTGRENQEEEMAQSHHYGKKAMITTMVSSLESCCTSSSSCSLPVVSQLSSTPSSSLSTSAKLEEGEPASPLGGDWGEIDKILRNLTTELGGVKGKGEAKCEVGRENAESAMRNWLRAEVGIAYDNAAKLSALLVCNGYDSVPLMKGSLTTLEMTELGVERSLQLSLTTHLQNRMSGKIEGINRFTHVCDWLDSLALSGYAEAFAKANLTLASDVIAARLARSDLEKLGVKPLGHLRRILNSLRLASRPTGPVNCPTRGWGAPCQPPSSNGNPKLSRGEVPLEEGPSLCVSLNANYLGSEQINSSMCLSAQKMDWSAECRRVMAKLKSRLTVLSALPHMLLEVSAKGVVLKSHSNTNPITSPQPRIPKFHPIERIQIVCQDEVDLNCFSYIAQDGEGEHVCHAFCVLTAGIASEAITAIGEAFRLAYFNTSK